MRIFNILAAVILAGLLVFFGAYLLWGRGLPKVSDLDVLELGGKSAVYDRAGALVGALQPGLTSGSHTNRDLLKLGQISPFLRDAVVTSEDRRFYQHGAVDPLGLLRGLFRSASGDTQGGSTITQQVVKNTLLANIAGDRTLSRKFKEAILAYQVEQRFSKQDILAAYLNVVYWGAGRGDLIGAGQAAQAYFRVDASRLNLAQSAYLATMLPNPRRYFAFKDYRPLMHDLLKRMVEDGRVTQAQADAAWLYPLEPAGWRVRYDAQGNVRSATLVNRDAKRENAPAPIVRFGDSYLDEVDRQAAQLIGRSAVYKGGVKVYTYLDRQTQQSAEQASRDAQVPQGATLGMAFLDPRSGEVLALVGQKLGDGTLEEWNNATRSHRQVGSSVKPILYTTALANGWNQSDTLPDVPLTGDYQPQNYSHTYTGRNVTLRYALDHSLNLPTVHLEQQLGLGKFESQLSALGLTVPDNAGLSLGIGTLQASPLQMAAAYAPFANGGAYRAPRLISKIVGASGKVLYQDSAPAPKQVWSAQDAYLGLDMLQGYVNDLTPREGGLGWKARISGWPVGGKTGTTNDVKDLWFVGVTPVLSGAVWVGRADNAAMPENSYSGDIPTPVWQQAVSGALQGRQVTAFKVPAGIQFATVRGVQMAFGPQQDGNILTNLFGGGRQQADPPADQAQPDQTPDTTDQSADQTDPIPPPDQNQDGSDQSDQPDLNQVMPDQVVPDQNQPDQSQQDQTQPDQNTLPDSSDQTIPDPVTPDTTTPDQTVPDQNSQDQSTPDQTTPDQSSPDQVPQDQTTPDQTTPDQSAPTTDPNGTTQSDPNASGDQSSQNGSISVVPVTPGQSQ